MIFRRASNLLVTVVIASLFTLTSGCVSPSQKLDSRKYYKRDMIMKINGEKFVGVAVPKLAPVYKIEVETPGKISRMTFMSCHRDDDFKPDNGFFSSKKKYTYTYTPNSIEKGRGCLLDIGGFETRRFSDNGRHSWGMIAFDSEVENIPAIITCNGEPAYNTDPKSTSVCQGRTNSIQIIEFDHRVKFATKTQQPKCRVMQTKDDKKFIYRMPEGECLFYFRDQWHNTHSHHTSGYSTLLVRDPDYEDKKD